MIYCLLSLVEPDDGLRLGRNMPFN